MRILLTGFVPFPGVDINPSQLIVEQISQRGRFPQVQTAVLPVEYAAGGASLAGLIARHQPAAIICLGVAQRRSTISLERIALNLDDAGHDNAGETRRGLPIIPDAPLAYASTLPLDAMLAALHAQDIPAEISNHAGAYLCNHVFYLARHLTGALPCGFIHVPALENLPLETQVTAIETCLGVIAN